MLLDAVSLLITPLLHGGELVLIGAFLSTRREREGGRKGGREGRRKEGRKGGREGGKEGGREGGREGERKGGRGREEEREEERAMKWGRGGKHCAHTTWTCVYLETSSQSIFSSCCV